MLEDNVKYKLDRKKNKWGHLKDNRKKQTLIDFSKEKVIAVLQGTYRDMVTNYTI